MDFRKCFVPSCQNSSVNSRKIFIAVPKNRQIRRSWCLAVGRVNILSSISGGIYCCEDHFNMEQDCDNWMEFKMTNCKIRMKKNVVPSVVPHTKLGRIKVCPEVEEQQQEDLLELCAPIQCKIKVEEPTWQEVPPLLHIEHKSGQDNMSDQNKGVQVELKTKLTLATSPLTKIKMEKSTSSVSSFSTSFTSTPIKSEYIKEEPTDFSETS